MFLSEIHQEVIAQREALGRLVRGLDPDDLPASQAPRETRWRRMAARVGVKSSRVTPS